jgi:hypothetical protein
LNYERSYSQPGCTDPLATNYNATATNNNGSCIYPATSISPTTTFPLDASLSETSGLIKWNGNLWTHNDNTDIKLYALDTITGSIQQNYSLTSTYNEDWEEISQDSNYVYIGDFGNNVNGNRTDLHILRIEKNSLLASTPFIDTISFSYSDQTDFTTTGSNNTDFDCESFVVTSDSIYLFTKQWVSDKTSLYALPKIPGTFVAQLKTTFDVNGLITGATLLEHERIIALCGYTSLLQPFTWLLYDYTGSDFFGGNKRNISVSLPFHQVEGIATSDGLTFYMTNENFTIISTPQKLNTFDFSSYLSGYLNGTVQHINSESKSDRVIIYPTPSSGLIHIKQNKYENFKLTNSVGEIILSGNLNPAITSIYYSEPGIYFLTLWNNNEQYVQKIVLE